MTRSNGTDAERMYAFHMPYIRRLYAYIEHLPTLRCTVNGCVHMHIHVSTLPSSAAVARNSPSSSTAI